MRSISLHVSQRSFNEGSLVDYQILGCVGEVIRSLVFDPKVSSLTMAKTSDNHGNDNYEKRTLVGEDFLSVHVTQCFSGNILFRSLQFLGMRSPVVSCCSRWR